MTYLITLHSADGFHWKGIALHRQQALKACYQALGEGLDCEILEINGVGDDRRIFDSALQHIVKDGEGYHIWMRDLYGNQC